MHLIVFALIIAIILIYFYTPRRINVSAGGREWSVVESYENNTEAAALMSRVHDRMIKLFRALKEKYHIDETEDVIEEEGHIHNVASDDVLTIVHTLLNNYNPDVIYENDPRYSSDTSYTINKGSSMYVCLRKRDRPHMIEDEDLTFFVVLHEAAHIANYNGWGHDDRFWTVFKFLLHEAVLAGVYTPVDYEVHPQDYCGLRVFFQPLYDKSLPLLS